MPRGVRLEDPDVPLRHLHGAVPEPDADLLEARAVAVHGAGPRPPEIVDRELRQLRRLAPGVLQRLQEIIPRDDKGRFKFKLHQALTRDKGYLGLKEHLASVTTIMKRADDWAWFMTKLDKVHPKFDAQQLLPFLTANEIDAKGLESDE